jgi:N-ethylmaleimide reductase
VIILQNRFDKQSTGHSDAPQNGGFLMTLTATNPFTHLCSPATVGALSLKNRIVMAPMTRSRATPDNIPTALMAEYYGQRSGAGLIVTEGTSPSPNGVGYARIPGLWSQAQVENWRPATAAVHANGGRIVAQLMHSGRVGHALNLPPGAAVLAPSAVAVEGEIFTDAQGLQPYPTPRAMNDNEILQARGEYVQAAKNAIAAGFDGVELHAANGYLLEQFISPHANLRTDAWGGSIANRLRFVVETAQAVADAIGGGRVGIRLSPYGVNAGMKPYAEIDETYFALIRLLIPTGVQYVHLVDHSAMGAPKVPAELKMALRQAWPRTFMLAGGFDCATAAAAVQEGRADLIAFGRPFISNPDFVVRLEQGLPLAAPDFATFYTPGAKGYTDYPRAGQ